MRLFRLSIFSRVPDVCRAHVGVTICLLACSFSACGGNPNGSVDSPGGRSTLTVSVLEGTEPGVSGFEITTTPSTRTVFTDSTGSAFIPDMPLGVYTVFGRKDGYPPVSKDVVIEREPGFARFTFLPQVTVTIAHETKGPIVNAAIETTPPGISGRTDANGQAMFEHVLEQFYTFTIRHEGYPDITFEGVEPKPDLLLNVKLSFPEVAILSPDASSVYTVLPGGRPVRFTGAGTDIEDGALPDSSLVWYSSLDGVLGRGKEITVSSLSPGRHTIFLRGTDSDGMKSESSIALTVADYQLDSYFPIPSGEWWNYRFLVPEFYVTNEDSLLEYWVIKDFSVKTFDGPIRMVSMLYDIARLNKILHFKYILTDYFLLKNGDVSLTKTTEELTEWETAAPYRTISITTAYSPFYPVLMQASNLTAGMTSAFTVDIAVIWWHTSYGVTSPTYSEWETLPVAISVGEEREIQTDRGIIRAFEVTVSEKNIEKTWWLAKGIGIVRSEDNVFSPKATTVLSDASLLRFAALSPPSARPAETGMPGAGSHSVFRLDRRSPEGMRELTRFLSGMCPR